MPEAEPSPPEFRTIGGLLDDIRALEDTKTFCDYHIVRKRIAIEEIMQGLNRGVDLRNQAELTVPEMLEALFAGVSDVIPRNDIMVRLLARHPGQEPKIKRGLRTALWNAVHRSQKLERAGEGYRRTA